ncbi:Transcription factor, partial [Rhizopus azygosporus]
PATRRKWPNMKYLGSCTLHLGPHLFQDTSFYEAIRSEPWSRIIEAHQGVSVKKDDPEESTNEQPNQEPLQLQWIDVVFELKEVPSERYVFPKEALISVCNNPVELRASFALPLDPDMADEFFDTPKDKILKHGHKYDVEYVSHILATTTEKQKIELPFEQYEPANILLSNVNPEIIEAVKRVVQDPKDVKKRLSLKVNLFPQKRYIQFDNNKAQEIKNLLMRIQTVPDIITGPIMAEKKRNEILNAIKLGKRERDEKFEAELPKTKMPGVRDESMLRCTYCGTKYTSMWRPGPGGHGTLCNSCGIQWKRGEILEGAPVISLKEERKLLWEKKQREKAAEALEMEKLEKDNKKLQRKLERTVADASCSDGTRGAYFAAQLVQQRQNKVKKDASPINDQASLCVSNSSGHISLPPTSTNTANTTSPSMIPIAPGQQQQQQQQQQASIPGPTTQPFSLYSAGGIPLPTLSIDFGGALTFSHPNCGITLLDIFFSIRLCKDGYEQTTIQIDKRELVNSSFEITKEGDAQNTREILKMKIASAEPKAINAFGTMLMIDSQQPITVRFLEKLDPSGGAVVQRILQRWLVTFPQQ